MRISYLIVLGIIIPFAIGVDYAFAANEIPDWVKNNALWWAEGKISEQEYLNSIQFLIEKKIILVGSTPQSSSEYIPGDFDTLFGVAKEKTSSRISPFSKTIVPESNRAIGYIVKISGGELIETQIFHTFGKFQPGEDPVFINSLQSQGFSSYFSLESLPSKDKADLYHTISRYFNPGKTPEPMDVDIDIISGDGSTIVTINYNKCILSEYLPYLQNFVFVYPLGKEYGPEIRERTIFSCQGYQVEVNPKREKVDLSLLNSIPDDAQAKKFVVRFFNGEIKQVFSTTFRNFAPSIETFETPFVTMTAPGNQIDGPPQFFLESLPSYDKKLFYDFLSRYVNPVKEPEPFDVSVDLLAGDNTILQRWNYVDCKVTNYQMRLDDSMLSYPFSKTPQGEIRDKTDFACAGQDLLVHDTHQINNYPIYDAKSTSPSSDELELLYAKEPPIDNDRAMSYRIHASDGELEFTRTTEQVPIFEALSQNRGPLTPLNHPKQYNFGFFIEATPDKDKTELYNYLARYVNPGKQPEPIDVDVEVLTGDGRILTTLQYKTCTAIDFDWYSQDFLFLYQITNESEEEIREKYIFYCDGYTIDVE